jgi:hypothetical protein
MKTEVKAELSHFWKGMGGLGTSTVNLKQFSNFKEKYRNMQ